MSRRKKYYLNSEKGFALIAAIIACVILLALGALVVTLSTGDIKTSSQVVADKRAMAAAEKGIHHLVRTFDPANRAACAQTTADATDLAVDANSQYSISTPVPVSTSSGFVDFTDMKGFSTIFGMARYNVDIVGSNSLSNTRVRILVGIGYGPVSKTTQYQ